MPRLKPTLILIILLFNGCSIQELRQKLHHIKAVITRADEDEKNTPFPEPPAQNRTCCWCQSPPEGYNALFPARQDEDCSLKNVTNFFNCKKVVLIEGDCSWSNSNTKSRGSFCNLSSRFYLEHSLRREISPPPTEYGPCDKNAKNLIEKIQSDEGKELIIENDIRKSEMTKEPEKVAAEEKEKEAKQPIRQESIKANNTVERPKMTKEREAYCYKYYCEEDD